MVNAAMWISFAPIKERFSTYYFGDLLHQDIWCDMLSIVYSLMYLPGTVLASWSFQRYGFRNGLLIGAFLQALGGWLRFVSTGTEERCRFGHYGYTLLIVGQALAALSQPYFTNSVTKFTSIWSLTPA